MKEKVPLGYRMNLNHWQVAHQFAVQNLTLPPSMSVAKVTEYFYCQNQALESQSKMVTITNGDESSYFESGFTFLVII